MTYTCSSLSLSPHSVSDLTLGNTDFPVRPDACKAFLLQCSLALELQPQRFPTERSRIAYIISLLSGHALPWAESVWNHSGQITESVDNFVAHFKEVFGIPEGDSMNQTKLFTLRQSRSMLYVSAH